MSKCFFESGYCTATLSGTVKSFCSSRKELLEDTPASEIDLTMFGAMLHGDLSAEVVSALIDAGADVNHQLSLPFFSALGVLFAGYSLKHRWKSSTLSTYAYHHEKATPLMCSIITSSFEAWMYQGHANSIIIIVIINPRMLHVAAKKNTKPMFPAGKYPTVHPDCSRTSETQR